ncbi:DUF2306 domain-containing protein [Hymenobacter sp. GOD-10R]|uniref:DUF2306 domain-containing protein n=1 Tax=Hymenobacter sp. GOD-10R TaxID=3093922 RepID=UPI002D7723CB|nr:DUF2306 domain-containing protein [Hymenobacter sp. GOD-10R]WRQ27664.1 DUF2306 domain-containing protein [Hymenobacter sp. GOD-10R]
MLYAILFSLPPTTTTVRALLGLHIAAGSLALLAGLIPMLGRKGGPVHVRAGRVYVYSMLVVAATAVLLCLLQPLTLSRLFLTGIAVLSFYLSFTGWRAARQRSAKPASSDLVLSTVATLVGLGMVGIGIALHAVLFAFFGGLICLFAGQDTWVALRGTAAAPMPWLLRHLTRMGGSYISATTAFIVVNLGRWLPAGAPSWINLLGWMAPTILGSILIARTVRYYKAKLTFRNTAPEKPAISSLE